MNLENLTPHPYPQVPYGTEWTDEMHQQFDEAREYNKKITPIVEEIIHTREGQTTKDGITVLSHHIEDGFFLNDNSHTTIYLTTTITTATQQATIESTINEYQYEGLLLENWSVENIHTI